MVQRRDKNSELKWLSLQLNDGRPPERQRKIDLRFDLLEELGFWVSADKLTADISEKTFELAVTGHESPIDWDDQRARITGEDVA
jgi:hypothetical protein